MIVIAKYYSPLRYPGGKTKLYGLVRSILMRNNLINQTYIEPFAGGAGLALALLLNNDVKKIVINDSDPAIYAFWYSILNNNEDICEFVRTVPLNMDEWHRQRNIYLNQANYERLDIAKAVFYLNRTNRSGVINGGVIGGQSQQGNYLIDARFNRNNLIERIQSIENVKSKIHLYNLDVLDFLDTHTLGKYRKVLINFDPPYVEKGSQLYQNYYTHQNHKVLKKYILKCKRKWILTYDDCELTRELYANNRCSLIDINYSVNTVRKTKELIVFSDSIEISDEVELL